MDRIVVLQDRIGIISGQRVHVSAKVPESDFRRKVAEAYVDVRNHIDGWVTGAVGEGQKSYDPQVKEQVRGDVDKLIEKNRGG